MPRFYGNWENLPNESQVLTQHPPPQFSGIFELLTIVNLLLGCYICRITHRSMEWSLAYRAGLRAEPLTLMSVWLTEI